MTYGQKILCKSKLSVGLYWASPLLSNESNLSSYGSVYTSTPLQADGDHWRPFANPDLSPRFCRSLTQSGKARQHDLLFIVAGGVGIAPYLSLLDMLLTDDSSGDGADGIHHQEPTPSIRLHWICREPQLVEYVRKSHFSKLRTSSEMTVVSKSSSTTPAVMALWWTLAVSPNVHWRAVALIK